jgi:hypothetical protein
MCDGGRSRRGGAAAVLALACAALAATPAEAQTWRTLTSSRQLWGPEPVAVEIEYGAGTLEIERIESPSLLYRMEMRYDEERMTPVAEFDSASRRLRLGSEGRDSRGGRMHEGSHLDVALSDRVPLHLGLHFGAGEAELDLGGLRIQSLDVETGASQTTVRIGSPNPIRAESVELQAGAAELRVIGLGNLRADRITFQGGVGSATLDFSGSWAGNASATVQMGMGEVVLRFPRSLGVQINRSSFLTSFEADGFERRDESYFSDNWDRSSRRLTVSVEAALGSIEVEWIDE